MTKSLRQWFTDLDASVFGGVEGCSVALTADSPSGLVAALLGRPKLRNGTKSVAKVLGTLATNRALIGQAEREPLIELPSLEIQQILVWE